MKKLLIGLSVLHILLFSGCATSTPSVKKVSDVKSGAEYIKLAEQYMKKEDKLRAIKSSTKACDLNDGKGCFYLGAFFESGEGVKKDYLKASKYYKRGCDLNNNRACWRLGQFYYHGEKGIKEDFRKAEKYLKKACVLKVRVACSKLGMLYCKGGDGIKGDYSKGMKYIKKGCDMGDEGACFLYKTVKKHGKEKIIIR